MGEPPRTRFQLRSYILHIHEIWEFARGRSSFLSPSPAEQPDSTFERGRVSAEQSVTETVESSRAREREAKTAFRIYVALMSSVIVVFAGWTYMNVRREVTTLASWKLVTDAGVTKIQFETVNDPQFAAESVISDKLEQHLK